jgi:hypothetical protein
MESLPLLYSRQGCRCWRQEQWTTHYPVSEAYTGGPCGHKWARKQHIRMPWVKSPSSTGRASRAVTLRGVVGRGLWEAGLWGSHTVSDLEETCLSQPQQASWRAVELTWQCSTNTQPVRWVPGQGLGLYTSLTKLNKYALWVLFIVGCIQAS